MDGVGPSVSTAPFYYDKSNKRTTGTGRGRRRFEFFLIGSTGGVAERVGGMARKVGLRGEVYLSGGVALNPAVAAALGEVLGVEVAVLPEPQLNGAYGAALTAVGGA